MKQRFYSFTAFMEKVCSFASTKTMQLWLNCIFPNDFCCKIRKRSTR